jgi:uncharacterized protein
MPSAIPIDKNAITVFCKKHHIRSLSLFGSVLRDDFRPDSDIDVLVAFEQGHIPGFIRLQSMEEELSALMGGRAIDLVTEKFLNYRIKPQVMADSEVQYAQG